MRSRRTTTGIMSQAPTTKQVFIFALIAAVSIFVFKLAITSVNKVLEQLGLKKTDDEKKQDEFNTLIEAVESGEVSNVTRSGTEYKADAQAIATALGTNYSWYNPWGWTEDEEAATAILLDYNTSEFPILESMYRVETGGRGLQDDCVYYLDAYLEQVKFLWE